jgi:hypothetical protein
MLLPLLQTNEYHQKIHKVSLVVVGSRNQSSLMLLVFDDYRRNRLEKKYFDELF